MVLGRNTLSLSSPYLLQFSDSSLSAALLPADSRTLLARLWRHVTSILMMRRHIWQVNRALRYAVERSSHCFKHRFVQP